MNTINLISPMFPIFAALFAFGVIWLVTNFVIQPYLEKCTQEQSQKSLLCQLIRNSIDEESLKND
jgi:hypothetical protein